MIIIIIIIIIIINEGKVKKEEYHSETRKRLETILCTRTKRNKYPGCLFNKVLWTLFKLDKRIPYKHGPQNKKIDDDAQAQIWTDYM